MSKPAETQVDVGKLTTGAIQTGVGVLTGNPISSLGGVATTVSAFGTNRGQSAPGGGNYGGFYGGQPAGGLLEGAPEFGNDITGIGTGDYDNPEGNPGSVIAVPTAAPPPPPKPEPEPDGGHGGGIGTPDIPDIPEPPEIPLPPKAPRFPNPNDLSGGGPSVQKTVDIIDDAQKYGRQSTIVSGIEDDESLGDVDVPGLTPAAGRSVSAAQTPSPLETSVVQEFDELEAETLRSGARGPIEPSKTPTPSGYTLVRSYSTMPYDVLQAKDGSLWLRNRQTGEIVSDNAFN
jgi:hypothetical protein